MARLQTLPSAFGLLLHRSLACVRREPGEGASGTCSPCTAALELSLRNLPPRQPSNPSRQLAGLPLLFLWASESDVRHFGPASNPSQRLWPTPASQPCLRQAGAWGGSLWNVQPVHCSLRTEPNSSTYVKTTARQHPRPCIVLALPTFRCLSRERPSSVHCSIPQPRPRPSSVSSLPSTDRR